MCAHSEGGDAEVRDLASFMKARFRPAFMLVRAKSYWHGPPLTRAPAPAPPLRLSLPAVQAGLRLCPGRLLGCLRYTLRAPSAASSLVRAPGGVSIAPASPGAYTLMCLHNGHSVLATRMAVSATKF